MVHPRARNIHVSSQGRERELFPGLFRSSAAICPEFNILGLHSEIQTKDKKIMKTADGHSKLDVFLKHFGGEAQPLGPILSAEQVLYRLAEMEEEAAGYYEGLAKNTDLVWVRSFASRFAEEEQKHRQRYLERARAVGAGSMSDQITQPLSPEIVRLLSYHITPGRSSAEKTAVYFGEKDSVEFAINAECNTIILLRKLLQFVPEEQHDVIKTILREEMGHKSSLEEIMNKHLR